MAIWTILRGKADEGRYARATLINSIGRGIFFALSTLYFTQILGMPLTLFSMFLTLSAVAGLAGSVLFGRASDKVDAMTMYRTLLAVQGLGLIVYVVTDNFICLGITMAVVSTADRGAAAARGPIIAHISQGENRVSYRAMLRVVSNVGTAMGSVLSAIPLTIGTRPVFVALILFNVLTYFTAALMLRGVQCGIFASAHSRKNGRMGLVAVRDVPFLLVTAANAVLYLHDGILTIALPIWIASAKSIPNGMVSALLLVNTVGVILLQVRFARGTDSIRGAGRAGLRSGLSLCAACVLLALSREAVVWLSVVMLVAAGLMHLCGELWQSASAWSFGFEMSGDDLLGEYQGVLNAGADTMALVSPMILTGVAHADSPAGWLVLAVVFLLTGLSYGPIARLAVRTRSK